MTIDGMGYFEKEKAGAALIERCKAMTSPDPTPIGEYRGFMMELSLDSWYKTIKLTLRNHTRYSIEVGTDVFGNIQRIDNAIEGIGKVLEKSRVSLQETKKQFETAKAESVKEFPQEAELNEKLERLAKLDALLNMDKSKSEAIDTVPDEGDMPKKKNREMER